MPVPIERRLAAPPEHPVAQTPRPPAPAPAAPDGGHDRSGDVRPASDDPANAGIRTEPELPVQEEIVARPTAPQAEIKTDEAEGEIDAAAAAQLREQLNRVASQAAMDPKDGMEL